MSRAYRDPALRATVEESRAFLARARETLARSRHAREALRQTMEESRHLIAQCRATLNR